MEQFLIGNLLWNTSRINRGRASIPAKNLIRRRRGETDVMIAERPPRVNNRKLTPWTGGTPPIDPGTAWPNGLRLQKPERSRLLQPQTVWP
eukprot:COSAG01_NODE_35840_length_525_cov_44.260563_1_plen_90_part_10